MPEALNAIVRPSGPREEGLDDRIWVSTPEQIRFRYQTVGGLRRVLALVLDLIFIGLLVSGAMVALSLAGIVATIIIGFNPQLVDLIFGLGTGLLMIALFFIWWFYGVYMEYYYGGRTWGKIAMGIRALSADGRPLTYSQCVWRNFLRLADSLPVFPVIYLFPAGDTWMLSDEFGMESQTVIQSGFAMSAFFPTFGVAVLSMMLSARNQRVGDLFAGTMVIESEAYQIPQVPVFDDAELLALSLRIPRDFSSSRELAETLSLYVSRRRRFSIERRREIARNLSEVLLPQFGISESTDPDVLMGALYLRTICEIPQLESMYEKARGVGVASPPQNPARSLT